MKRKEIKKTRKQTNKQTNKQTSKQARKKRQARSNETLCDLCFECFLFFQCLYNYYETVRVHCCALCCIMRRAVLCIALHCACSLCVCIGLLGGAWCVELVAVLCVVLHSWIALVSALLLCSLCILLKGNS
jgi:hypothetical protein